MSRKRSNPLNVPQDEHRCHWGCCEDYQRGNGQRFLKRLKPAESLGEPASSNALIFPPDFTLPNVSNESFLHTYVQTDPRLNDVDDGFSMPPPSTSLDSLSVSDQPFPQQHVVPTSDFIGTPATYTATDDTLSPGSMNQQPLFDIYDCAIEGQDGTNEQMLLDPDDHSIDFVDELDEVNGLDEVNEWTWDTSNSNLLQLGGSVASDPPPYITRLISGGNDDTLSFSDRILEVQDDEGRSPSVQARANSRLTRPSDEPRFFSQSPDDGVNNLPKVELPLMTKTPTKSSQAIIPQNFRLKALEPPQSFLKTPIFTFRNSTVEPPLQGFTSEKPELKSQRKHGCRGGPLAPQNKEHAKETRKAGACWRCRLWKVRCSSRETCERCQKASTSPLNGRICLRVRLPDYKGLFFPDLVRQRLSESAVSALIRKSANFTERKIEVEMLSGPKYPVIRLMASEFVPLNNDIIALNCLVPKTGGGNQELTQSYAPPIGLHNINPGELGAVCRTHIRSIIKLEQRHAGEYTDGDISKFSWLAFEAVNRYRKSKGKENGGLLLRKAAMLHAMHFFMSRLITFTNASAKEVIGRLQNPSVLPFKPTLTSTLLNLQIKQAMQSLRHDITGDVLTSLERLIEGPKTIPNWIDTFCVILLLCICIEAAQVENDNYTVAALRSDPTCGKSRAATCHALDKVPFKELTDLFHLAYKMHKSKHNQKCSKFNLIRNGLSINQEEGVTPEMVDLVNNIQQIITAHGNEMAEKAKDISFDSKADLLTSHVAFRKRNSGRLLSKFLISLKEGY